MMKMTVRRNLMLTAFLLLAAPPLLLAQSNEPIGGPVPDEDAPPFASISTPASGAANHDVRAPSSVAVPLTGEIVIDGKLDEPIWQTAPAITQFFQKEPVEALPPRSAQKCASFSMEKPYMWALECLTMSQI